MNPAAQPGVQTAQFTPGPAQCPAASKLGTVQIDTPLLGHPIEGGLYLATPHANPFGSLLAVYLAAYDPISGVVVKLPGQVSLGEHSGRVTATFDQNPQLPFSRLEVDLFKDQLRAPFTTPETCGSYVTTTLLEPWSHGGQPGEAGTPDATPFSEPFKVTELPGGGACPGTEAQAPNAPGLFAGAVSPIAGAFSPFVLRLSREDGSQRFGALNVTLPAGLVGKVAGVQQCPQADIEAAQRLTAQGDGAVEQAHPSCPSGSLLGVVHVGAGSGAALYVNGQVYFAGPYEGAPFSLVIITPAVAGPFDLGTVVVRAALFINPETAQVTVSSDPFPSILDGIPLDIKSVDVEMTRPGFTLNPTNCNAMSVTGQEISTAGQAAALSDRFQVGGCDTMAFHPRFTASTSAHTSRKDGASLRVRLAYPAGSLGREANLAYAKVQLPKALPSELKTLKLACLARVFDANPAACPAESVVGHATVHTPLLPVALEGPAYFVSNGSEGFPNLDLVLQGDGVRVDLVGDTFIGKGVTTATFGATPDVPFESFELTLPRQPYSALGANGNLCQQQLSMPTRIVAQNGVAIEEKTPIEVQGCANRIAVTSRKLKGRTLTLHVAVPSRGRLTVAGAGFTTARRFAHGREVLTLKLHVKLKVLKRMRKHALGTHHAKHAKNVKRRSRTLTTRLTLKFKPAHGRQLTRRIKTRL